MIITEVIQMLEIARKEYGDLEVYIDGDYGQWPIDASDNPFYLSPRHEEEAENLPERVVIS